MSVESHKILAELHKILDNENKIISLEEYQNILYQLKNDTISLATREEFESQEETPKYHWYSGETNAFQIALDLSEHINQNQKAIECLKEVEEWIFKNIMFDTEGIIILNYIQNKIKELKGEE